MTYASPVAQACPQVFFTPPGFARPHMPLKILIPAGEASGELYAANLAVFLAGACLKSRTPPAESCALKIAMMIPSSRTLVFHHALLRAAAVCSLAVTLAGPALSQLANDPANPAIVPADRLAESWWADRHRAVLETVRSHQDAQLLMIGDSITNNYDKSNPPDENFQATWKEFYEPRRALNLGFSGDTTAQRTVAA